MFIFIPKTKDNEEKFITDSIFLYFFYNLIKILQRRKSK